MNKEQFVTKLNQLKSTGAESNYYLSLRFKGNIVGLLDSAADFDEISVVDDKVGYLIIGDDSLSIFVDNADLVRVGDCK